MGEASKIEWTDHTFNPWVGCEKVSPACDRCYAQAWAERAGHPELWEGRRRRTTPANWRQPHKWHAKVPDGQRQRVFCASLADVFDNTVPELWRWDLFETIRATPRLDWLLLTKRIGNAKRMLRIAGMDGAYNIWLGATVVNQEEADRDIPKLLATPARVRFLSCEPLLGPIDLEPYLNKGLHWVICGGESGHGARPMSEAWAHQLRTECLYGGVAFFMKQGSQTPEWPAFKDITTFHPDLRVREFPRAA